VRRYHCVPQKLAEHGTENQTGVVKRRGSRTLDTFEKREEVKNPALCGSRENCPEGKCLPGVGLK